jgi:hypothetical protein
MGSITLFAAHVTLYPETSTLHVYIPRHSEPDQGIQDSAIAANKRPIYRQAVECAATPPVVSSYSMQKPRTDICIHHKFLDSPQHPLVPRHCLTYPSPECLVAIPTQRRLRMAKLTKSQAARQLGIARSTPCRDTPWPSG